MPVPRAFTRKPICRARNIAKFVKSDARRAPVISLVQAV